MAMYNRSTDFKDFRERNVTCIACKVKGHNNDKCWTIIGYPPWHPKHKFHTQQQQTPNQSYHSSNATPAK